MQLLWILFFILEYNASYLHSSVEETCREFLQNQPVVDFETNLYFGDSIVTDLVFWVNMAHGDLERKYLSVPYILFFENILYIFIFTTHDNPTLCCIILLYYCYTIFEFISWFYILLGSETAFYSVSHSNPYNNTEFIHLSQWMFSF